MIFRIVFVAYNWMKSAYFHSRRQKYQLYKQRKGNAVKNGFLATFHEILRDFLLDEKIKYQSFLFVCRQIL